MIRKFIVVLGLVLLPLVSVADRLSLKAGAPEVYTVKKGDTLWDISGMYLEAPWLWPDLWEVNPSIENPHLIYPGDRISLVYVDGVPKLRINDGAPGVTKLSPEVRESPLSGAIPLIQTSDIAAWVREARIVDQVELESAPYIVAGTDDRLLLSSGDRVFVTGLAADRHRVQGIYRAGDTYRDPVTGQLLGLEAVEIGVAHIESSVPPYDEAVIVRANQEVRPGDRLIPSEAKVLDASIYPSAPQGVVTGSVISVGDNQTRVGRFSAAVINVGRSQGLERGHVLKVVGPDRAVRDPITGKKVTLPGQTKGHVLVYRSFETLAYVLVMDAAESLLIGDLIRNP